MTIKCFMHLCILFICSVEDWKKKTIALWKICFYGFAAAGIYIGELLFQSSNLYESLLSAAAGAIPGIILFLLGKASDEAIGYGDCWIVLILGISMGFWNVLGILSTAFWGIFTWAVCVFLKKKKSRNKQIPFIPFLTIGMVGVCIWNM